MKEPTLDDLRAILFRGVKTEDANLDRVLAEIQALRQELHLITGTRLNREQLSDRLCITTRTLYSRIENGSVPRPGRDGRWLLSDIMEWEREGAPGRTRFCRD